MDQVRRVFFYESETQQPFGHEDLLDEEKEEDLPGLQDDVGYDDEEPAQQGRWMAPSLFGSMFGRPSEQPEAVLVDEVSRRGGYPQAAAKKRPAKPAKEDATMPLNQNNLDARGTFEKRSPWWVEGWRPRNFLLKDGKLLYFPKNRQDRPLGVLDFALLHFEIHCCWGETEAADEEGRRACDVCQPPTPEDFGTFFLKPQDFPNKVFAFRGPVEHMKVLAAKVGKIIRTRKQIVIDQERAAVTGSNFWRYGYISAASFVEQSECGDILLFRGSGGRCQLIRSVTAGKYDHVALLLRNQQDNVMVLEATGSDGVSLIPWKNFVGWGWHKCYERLAFRKVYFDRDSVQMEKLQQYVYSILGAHYSLTYDKIFKKKNSFSFDEKGRENTPESIRPSTGAHDRASGSFYGDVAPGPENFFCSEVVAACLKRCGVLAGARASATYWPSSFSQYDMESLPLHEGVSIGAEQVILFD